MKEGQILLFEAYLNDGIQYKDPAEIGKLFMEDYIVINLRDGEVHVHESGAVLFFEHGATEGQYIRYSDSDRNFVFDLEKLRRRVRDALNKTADKYAVWMAAKLLKVKIN